MGVMPVCSLKYLPKNEALGNCRSSAICCMVISVKRRRFSIAWRVKKQTISLGRLNHLTGAPIHSLHQQF